MEMEMPISIAISSFPIIVTTRRVQNKTHHKRRINKKWLKRYGYTDYEFQDQEAFFYNGKLYVTMEAFEKLKYICGDIKLNVRYAR